MVPHCDLLTTTGFLLFLVGIWGGAAPSALPTPDRLWCGPSSRPEVERVDTRERLRSLRAQLRNVEAVRGSAIHAFIITSHDEHQSEYVAEHDRRREFITGFNGSYGTAVVTMDKAALWTDGRYYVQADRELGCEWMLMREGRPEVPSIPQWLNETIGPGRKVGADARLVPHFTWTEWREELDGFDIRLIPVSENLVDLIWTTGRPPYSAVHAYPYPTMYAGKKWEEKVKEMQEYLRKLGADAMVVTALDDVAWLLNVRARDIPFVPVVRSYVLLTALAVHIYAPQNRLNSTWMLRRHLHTESPVRTLQIRMFNYSDIFEDLRTLSQAWTNVILPARYSFSPGASEAIYSVVPPGKRMPMASPVMMAKAQKNEVEREGMRKAHIRDAAALCDFFAYLELKVHSGTLDEAAVADDVDGYRMSQEHNQGASFETIVGYGPNGALPHYTPPRKRGTLAAPGVGVVSGVPLASGGLKIGNDSTLVIDSGGQYYEGTTDVTRTLHFGTPTPFQKEVYTRILSGHLTLSTLVFPEEGTEVADVDALARAPLWAVGLNYRHGTGHGVGSFLSVHEAPISLSYDDHVTMKFKEGYFFSNEPGYYHDAEFGIRLENVLEVVKAKTKYNFDGPYLALRPVTLVPYEPKLIDLDLLSNEHRRMLNDYNARVRTEVGAELKRQNKMEAFYWMMSKTQNIAECRTVTKSGRSSKSRSSHSSIPTPHPWLLVVTAWVLSATYRLR
ncbi:xaa-Pro aminopeptidase 1-like [Ischnura elegans]|uniref:xaa-Pro aminopeptidase 1-like n=1 Tax=Ischnura elegans TaxID=197161 RepID=UPI001ED8A450|nr:xaa-Pro aminopeptidase 1-like [Ischnura elegans]